MKIRFTILFLALALALAGGTRGAVPSAPVISTFSPNGLLVCTNLSPGTIAAVAWASSLNGPWSTNLAGLNAITVSTNGSIQVTVPVNNSGTMFYRVLGVNPDDGMALIPAGSFAMGYSAGDVIPNVQLTNIDVSSFYMDTNLITWSQWQITYAYALANGYSFDDAGSAKDSITNQPVQTLNWYDAVKWCNARSQRIGLTPVYYKDLAFTQVYTNGDTDAVYPNWGANGYQLPTEAQWEKAARGGLSEQRFPWGNTISESQANYDGNTEQVPYDLGPDGYNANFDSGSQPYTSPVGSFPSNGYGLNDMAGNLFQWCWDWDGAYGLPTTNNPTGAPSGVARVVRGGSWAVNASFVRTAYRTPSPPTSSGTSVGFRCVKNP
ncbi:MAG TPA: SUMF1/EgtB/PvdO family nonheme iron enzyme [Verrucomicrobiae bacterium]|nr:SUMF1/EgtB/PvdO family nonheme iron enzyme [Verrucomicrobiae bacterium]